MGGDLGSAVVAVPRSPEVPHAGGGSFCSGKGPRGAGSGYGPDRGTSPPRGPGRWPGDGEGRVRGDRAGEAAGKPRASRNGCRGVRVPAALAKGPGPRLVIVGCFSRMWSAEGGSVPGIGSDSWAPPPAAPFSWSRFVFACRRSGANLRAILRSPKGGSPCSAMTEKTQHYQARTSHGALRGSSPPDWACPAGPA
jgi:hypothetical protein